MTVRSLEWTGRELCGHCTSEKPRSGYLLLLVSFVLCACSSQISSPFLPVLKCWKYSAYEDALPVKDCKSVMCEEIFNDTMINMFHWVEKPKQVFWQLFCAGFWDTPEYESEIQFVKWKNGIQRCRTTPVFCNLGGRKQGKISYLCEEVRVKPIHSSELEEEKDFLKTILLFSNWGLALFLLHSSTSSVC